MKRTLLLFLFIFSLFLNSSWAQCQQTTDTIIRGMCPGTHYIFGGHIINNAGIYSDTLAAIGGCDSIVALNLFSYTPLTVTTAVTNTGCDSLHLGSIVVTAGGGTPPYQYSIGHYISGPRLWQNSDTLKSLFAGSYYVGVEDSNMCLYWVPDTVLNGNLHATADVHGIPCLGAIYGYIDLHIFGGNPPYTDSLFYASPNGYGGLSPFTSSMTTVQFGNLLDNYVYGVYVTDSLGCTYRLWTDDSIAHVTVDAIPDELPYTCIGPGSICLSPYLRNIGRDPTASLFHYLWSTGDTTPCISVSNTALYQVTVTDTSGCSGIFFEQAYSLSAGPDQITYGYSYVHMQASSGPGRWYALPSNPAPVSFSDSSYYATYVSVPALQGIYALVWTDGSCSDTMNIIVNLVDAGSNQHVCINSVVTLAAAGGTGQWSQLSGNPAYIHFADAWSPTSAVTGFIFSGIYNFAWTVNGVSDTVSVIVARYVTDTVSQTICSSDSVWFEGIYYHAAGVYGYSNGCDTMITLLLSVKTIYRDTVSQAICAGDSFKVGTHIYSTAGTHSDTLQASNSCDSIIILRLTILPSFQSTITRSICTGDSIRFGTRVYITSGTYNDTLQAGNSCDSIVTMHLTVTALPIIIWSQRDTHFFSWCHPGPLSIQLDSAVPMGGTFSGNYVTGNSLLFIPWHWMDSIITIIYTFADSNGCVGSLSKDFHIIIGCEGINEVNGLNVILYPNPNQGSFTLETNDLAGNAEYVIYDMIGNMIAEKNISKPQEQISLSVVSGVYTLVVRSENGTRALRLVVE